LLGNTTVWFCAFSLVVSKIFCGCGYYIITMHVLPSLLCYTCTIPWYFLYSSLSSVEPPQVWFDLKLPTQVIEERKLSSLQLESIVYACQQHMNILSDGTRAGFLVGKLLYNTPTHLDTNLYCLYRTL